MHPRALVKPRLDVQPRNHPKNDNRVSPMEVGPDDPGACRPLKAQSGFFDKCGHGRSMAARANPHPGHNDQGEEKSAAREKTNAEKLREAMQDPGLEARHLKGVLSLVAEAKVGRTWAETHRARDPPLGV